ncbi:hypothetical protein [Rubrivivax albus]|uniref:Uncharacterized protein n=1 Tax=Rubrivivax albus TaxID=2499835 RepID=A0A437K0S0_9BURK|nr:hypothetical protein [Rubrivivax albus]RVT53966.1 hypothetical protein ENE75_03560 [Rubrivivax albus]
MTQSPDPHSYQPEPRPAPARITRQQAAEMGYRTVSGLRWHFLTVAEQDALLADELRVVAARGIEPDRNLPMATTSAASKSLARYHEHDHEHDHVEVDDVAVDDEEAIA